MKKLWNVLVLTLALNFLAVAGLAGWLVQSKKLDRTKAHAIKAILFPTELAECKNFAEMLRPMICNLPRSGSLHD